jgi:hypothetical protein
MSGPDPRDLTTVANFMSWVGATVTVPDMQRLVTAVSNYIQSLINRNITSQSYTETRDGNGGTRMVLGQYPVTAVASVMVDGITIPPSPGPGQDGWVLANDGVSLRGYTFDDDDVANCVITYTAGYATTPLDLEQACLELAAMRWKERDRIGNASIAMGGQQTNFIIKDLPPSVATILADWKKVVPC